MWQVTSSKDLLWCSCMKDVTAASARRDLPRAVGTEGTGTGTCNSPSCRSELPPYQQLKIPEGSKAVNVREAKSRKNFINSVILFLFAQEG